MSISDVSARQKGILYIYSIAALLSDVSDGTETAGTEHNLVVVNEGILVDAPEDVTSRNVVADLDLMHIRGWKGAGRRMHALKSRGVKSHFKARSRASVLIPLGM